MPVCEKLSSLTYSLYCYSTQLEVFSALCPTSNIFMHDLPKGQRNLFAEMASGGTAGGHGELSGRSSDKTSWAQSSSVIHPTCSKCRSGSYCNALNSQFLSVCYFFLSRANAAWGLLQLRRSKRRAMKAEGKTAWVQKRNFHQVTPSIFGSHVNREEDKCQTWEPLAIRLLLKGDKFMSFFAKWIGSQEARDTPAWATLRALQTQAHKHSI